MQRITLHYRDEVIFQVHKVLGSVDFLGNPVGLFSTLSSGFGELFYEPYQGFIMSDRPQDLGIGIARVCYTITPTPEIIETYEMYNRVLVVL